MTRGPGTEYAVGMLWAQGLGLGTEGAAGAFLRGGSQIEGRSRFPTGSSREAALDWNGKDEDVLEVLGAWSLLADTNGHQCGYMWGLEEW